MKKAVIYKITSPSGKVYIGQTIDFKTRIWKYFSGNVKAQPKIYNSIKKYGWDSHSISILVDSELSKNDLNALEIFFIEYYQSFKIGLNMTRGGDGTWGYVQSERQRQGTSKRRKGSVASDYTKKLMSDSGKGKKKPVEFGKLVSIRLKGVKKTDSHKKNLSISRKGLPVFNQKKVVDSQTGIEYKSAGIAARELGIKESTFRGLANSKTNKRFNYLDDRNLNNSAGKKVINIDTGVEYKSAKHFSDETGYKYPTVKSWLIGKNKGKVNVRYA